MIRVLVADDSATARELLRAVLEKDGDIHVIAEAHDGAEAVRQALRHRPDIIVMDVHMPVADGLEATKEIMVQVPTPILIVSANRQRDVDLSLSATHAGALMALPKPDSPASPHFEEGAGELRSMTRAMSQVKVVRHWSVQARQQVPAARPRRRKSRPELVAIAASTGGPPALRRILIDLPRTFPLPILVVQHIARDFTAGFAEWLGAGCALPVKLAQQGELLRPGVVYVAPDDRHLGVVREEVRLSAGPPISGFRPSATHMFASAGEAYADALVAVILTGMGSDGAEGLVAARAGGAYVIAQDELTSIVYGMAGEAVRRGAVDVVLPLDRIAGCLLDVVKRGDHAD